MLTKDPIFSVVVPSYNRAHLIERTINSVMNQTYQNFELIIVDDGSTDNTEEVVRAISDCRVIFVKQKNAGACSARNLGIYHSKGVYVSFLDSDDEWIPTMLEKQLDMFNSDPLVGCVYSNVDVRDHNNKNISYTNYSLAGDIYSAVLKQGYMAPTSAVSVKKSLLEKIGGFDVQLPASQDDDLCFKCAASGRIALIEEPMVIFHIDSDQSEARISNNNKRVAMGWWLLWNKYESEVLQHCGKKVLRLHYWECIDRFAKCQDVEALGIAIKKYKSLRYSMSFALKYMLEYQAHTPEGWLYKLFSKMLIYYKRFLLRC